MQTKCRQNGNKIKNINENKNESQGKYKIRNDEIIKN